MNKILASLVLSVLFLAACASSHSQNDENLQTNASPSRTTASTNDEKGIFIVSSEYSLNTIGLQKKILEVLQKRSEKANITELHFEKIEVNSFRDLGISAISGIVGVGQMLSASRVHNFDSYCYDVVLGLSLNGTPTQFKCEAIGLWDYKSNRRSFVLGKCLNSDGRIEIENVAINDADLDDVLVPRKTKKIKL